MPACYAFEGQASPAPLFLWGTKAGPLLFPIVEKRVTKLAQGDRVINRVQFDGYVSSKYWKNVESKSRMGFIDDYFAPNFNNCTKVTNSHLNIKTDM